MILKNNYDENYNGGLYIYIYILNKIIRINLFIF